LLSAYLDKVRFRTSSGRVGEISSLQDAIVISYLEPYIDLTIILDSTNLVNSVRGWAGVGSYFNGYHISGRYGIRLYLDKAEAVSISLQSFTARDMLNLQLGIFQAVGSIFTLNVSRADDPEDEITPTDSQDITIIGADSAAFNLEVDSSGNLILGDGLNIGNYLISGDSNDNLFFTNLTDGLIKLKINPSEADFGLGVDIKQNGTTIDASITNLINEQYIQSYVDSTYIQTAANAAYLKGIIDGQYIQSIATEQYIKSFITETYIRELIDSL